MSNLELFKIYNKERIVFSNCGMVLSCSHDITKESFIKYKGKCKVCDKPLQNEEINFLRLSLNEPVITKKRDYSLHASSYDDQCPICSNNYNFTDTRLAILPCYHVCCFKCLSHENFKNKCYICRQQFEEDPIPYYFLKAEETSFTDAIETNFKEYHGGPLFHSGEIINQPPLEVIYIQEKFGRVINPKVYLWVFKSCEALIVRIINNIVYVLHRWEHIPESFISYSNTRREVSINSSNILRTASNATYSQNDNIVFTKLDNYYDFEPIVEGYNINFSSQMTDYQISDARSHIGQLIDGRDQWLTGVEIYPGLIMPSQSISVNNTSPLVVRYAFQRSLDSKYYDLVKLFVTIENNNIVKYVVYVYSVINGISSDGTRIQLGEHTGDSMPYINSNLIVHEVVHSVESSTFRETANDYALIGYTHIIDVASAWSDEVILSQLQECTPSIILYTTDVNNRPVGYNIDPQIHHNTQGVVIGITSLLTRNEERSTYKTLGWATNGYASDNLQTIQPIINTINTMLPNNLDIL
jgi:hypothetical protein